ncbi:hypothetical protein F2Q68_00007112 [Brassica cretica]|uniref:Matrin-type domain-containing protein n=1 Tax=Brassica cretica TaxID=69181 RepID=A0A8S9KVQ3_BRACR|nr:hypothetical protein F2Q68_00007112 [Brassica cretica]
MSSTLLEQTRSNHEEIERLERIIVQDLQTEPSSSKDRLVQGHRVRNMIQSIMRTTEKLVETYEDKDGAREDEIAALGGHTATGINVYSAFYDRLKEGFCRFKSQEEEGRAEKKMSSTLLEQTRSNHEEIERLERIIVQDLQTEPSSSKDRLVQGHRVRNMIQSIMRTTEKLVETYEDKDGAREDEIAALGGHTATGINVYSAFYDRLKEIREYHRKYPSGPLVDASADYEALLKVEPVISFSGEALGALGLKVGGTLQQRAERLFLTKDTPLEKLDKKHFAKPIVKQNGDAKATQEPDSGKQIALTEAKVKKLCSLLDETIERTKQNIVKKQALTYEEMEEEREGEEERAEEESDDEEGDFYNPLKLPMGWDGKPIPYWLYKLHGLGQKFECEICGNSVYMGRRAFERHFKEFQHQHGMRCLGIPNTKNFNEITSIEEAKELWKKIQERQGVNKWRPELEEEYEDREGLLLDRRQLLYLLYHFKPFYFVKSNHLSSFFDIREYHRKYPSGPLVDASADYEALLKVEPVISFSGEDTPLEKLDKKHFAKPIVKQNGDAKSTQEPDSGKQIALTEAKVKKLCSLLDETIERTKQNIVKKQALTYEEMEEEREGEEERAEEESDDEEGDFYNPLKLPMGWDGKPIPYWLYKLHGLGQKFECEICGNSIYMGRRAFERHFKEFQHQHGMRCLGIPNTKNFNEITSIEEAKELWKKIQERQGVNKWRPELEEEYEDREGNIYNKKTYSDLQRQGLI